MRSHASVFILHILLVSNVSGFTCTSNTYHQHSCLTRNSKRPNAIFTNSLKHESKKLYGKKDYISNIATLYEMDLIEFKPQDRVGIEKNVTKKNGKLSNFRTWSNRFRAFFLALALFVAPVFTLPDSNSALATETGGRMGGSFSRSYSSSPSRSSYGGSGIRSGSSYSTPRYYGSSGVGQTVVVPAPIGVPVYAAPTYYNPLTGIFNFFFNGIFLFVFATVLSQILSGSNSTNTVTSPLGNGVTVATLSVALNVPRRDDPNSILSYLTKLSNTASTDSRVGLQNLVSQVALELLRQRRSIFAANSEYKHYSDADKAIRDYNQKAIQERSKFEKETISKYKGVDYSTPKSLVSSTIDYKATVSVITLVIAIEGDSTKIPSPIRNVGDIERALTKLAADVKVEDCLLSAEVLWTPGDISETLTERDIYMDYPDLRSL